jgi:hypothetical protein
MFYRLIYVGGHITSIHHAGRGGSPCAVILLITQEKELKDEFDIWSSLFVGCVYDGIQQSQHKQYPVSIAIKVVHRRLSFFFIFRMCK